MRSAACRLFAEARPIRPGDTADRYLRGRALTRVGGEWPCDLRLHPRLRHPTGHVGTAIVAIVRDVAGLPVALARIVVVSFAAGDFDGDGAADLVVPPTQRDQLQILWNNGAGNLAPGPTP
ncbi:MAG: VCBS repeat-containing protein [Deltaproteobacteria bacterium]|nr:VCBS repeat-containing protein [Nannocystaceae bacterium]